MVNRDSEIVSKILSMDGDELEAFMEKLKPDTLEYLDHLLHKASVGTNTSQLRRYLDLNA